MAVLEILETVEPTPQVIDGRPAIVWPRRTV
jgi:hypothetical protein